MRQAGGHYLRFESFKLVADEFPQRRRSDFCATGEYKFIFGHEENHFWHFVTGKAYSELFEQTGLCNFERIYSNDTTDDHLAKGLMGHADSLAVSDALNVGERRVHFDRRDIGAACLDYVVQAPFEVQPTF